MLYSKFLAVLRSEVAEGGRHRGLIAYLRSTADRVLTQLELPALPPTVDRMAAISGLARSCRPGGLIVLEGAPDLSDLAAAMVDISPSKTVILAEVAVADRCRIHRADSAWLARIEKAALAMGVPCAKFSSAPSAPLGRAEVLVTGSARGPRDYAGSMPNLVCVLGVDGDVLIGSEDVYG